MRMAGAIFDLDGTLLDSMPVWDRFGELYLASRGVKAPANLAETLRTMSLPQSASYFKETFGFQETEEEILAGFGGMLAREYRERVPLKSGVVPFLDKLKQTGVKMCVATATDGDVAKAALARLGVSGFFSFVLTCAEAGYGKDSPGIFLMARERLGTKRQETFVFEDALHAACAAKEAGFPVVGVFDASTAGDRDEMMRLADRYIDSFEEWEDAWDA